MPPLLAAMGLAPVLAPRTNRSGHEIPLLARPPQDELDAWLRTNREDTILYAAARQFDDRSLERLRELVRPNGSSLRTPHPTSEAARCSRRSRVAPVRWGARPP